MLLTWQKVGVFQRLKKDAGTTEGPSRWKD
jgi:hypothetical protein